MKNGSLSSRVRAFRQFNRFYTRQIGLLNQGLLHTNFSLTQARILFELGTRKEITASDLIRDLEVDAGYLSRILGAFEEEKMLRVVPSKKDSRQKLLSLTASGKRLFRDLDKRSAEEAKKILQTISVENQKRLLDAMQAIQTTLEPSKDSAPVVLRPVVLRRHRPGDIGWVTYRHGALYQEEYGWDETFEALVADILVKFVQHHNAARERLWIAERDGVPLGSVMLVDAGNDISQLRLLLVEPKARGLGVGSLLIKQCIDFSKKTGYRKMKLWTQSNLLEARHLYSKFGWHVVEEKKHHSFGHDLTAEIWELIL